MRSTALSNRRLFAFVAAAAVIAFVSPGGAAAAPPAVTPAIAAQIDAIVQPLVTNRVTEGVTIGVGYQRAIVYAKGYGLRDVAAGLPMLATTPVGVGSVTKHVTVAALLRLAETVPGFSIDDSLAKWVPEYAPARTMTIRQVIYMVAGIPGANHDEAGIFGGAIVPISAAQVMANLNSAGTWATPGTGYDYSNPSYYLLGLVIARVSHVPYTTYLTDTFFRPLGMTATGFLDQPPPDASRGYYHLDTATPFYNCPELDASWALAPGGIVAPVGDMLKWDAALRSGQVVMPKDFQQMLVVNPIADLGMGLFVNPMYFGANGGLIGPQSTDLFFNDGIDVMLIANSRTVNAAAFPRQAIAVAVHNVLNAANPVPTAAPSPAPYDASATVPPVCTPVL